MLNFIPLKPLESSAYLKLLGNLRTGDNPSYEILEGELSSVEELSPTVFCSALISLQLIFKFIYFDRFAVIFFSSILV